MYRSLIRPILFALSTGDAEKAHTLAIRAAKAIQAHDNVLRLVESWYRAGQDCHCATVAGIIFPNKIGLAAGFDKNAEMLPLIQAFGFGFAEIGTVLPEFQEGNPRPRLFRIPQEETIINRLGFNSKGAVEVAQNLEAVRKKIHIPIGGSVGKMKGTSNEEAVRDYIQAWCCIRPYCAYAAVNISSPNTPGLRDLQGGRYIGALVHALVAAERIKAEACREKPKPILIKIAPDLTDAELEETTGACESAGASGFIVGNTSLTRPLRKPDAKVAKEAGGLSGKPIYYLNRGKFRLARRLTRLPIIQVGGLDTPDKVRQALDDGADLVQLYTGLIYKGPWLVSRARKVMHK